jgi:hypothetical protein
MIASEEYPASIWTKAIMRHQEALRHPAEACIDHERRFAVSAALALPTTYRTEPGTS